jgi:hypothetical protein
MDGLSRFESKSKGGLERWLFVYDVEMKIAWDFMVGCVEFFVLLDMMVCLHRERLIISLDFFFFEIPWDVDVDFTPPFS